MTDGISVVVFATVVEGETVVIEEDFAVCCCCCCGCGSCCVVGISGRMRREGAATAGCGILEFWAAEDCPIVPMAGVPFILETGGVRV